MIMSILLGYVALSYVVGLVIFLLELQKPGNQGLVHIGLILLALSPVTAWHGVRHYACKFCHKDCCKR